MNVASVRRRLREGGKRLLVGVRRTVRIGRWEVSRSAGTVDRKTVIALAVMALVVGGVGYVAAADGIGLENKIYVVGIDDNHPYAPVAHESDQFRVVSPEQEGVDLRIESTELSRSDSFTGDPAYVAFRTAVERHNERLMTAEADSAAAFPVTVSLEYQQREALESGVSGPADSGPGADDDANGDDSTTDDTETDGDSGPMSPEAGDDGPLQIPGIGGGSMDSAQQGTPSSISPPFPFQSLILAFLFVIPMNFVIQAYGSTIMDERIKRRGELLLVSPVSRYEIVAGKTLPYLVGVLAVIVGIAAFIGGGLISIAAALPIALLFLAATFIGAMFARSFKELTFVTVTISVFLTTYAFVPAIFTDVTPIALISPLTLIVMDLQGEAVSAGAYLFSTAAFYFGAAVLFGLGLGVYREEDMFTQKAVPSKLIDAIAARVHSRRSIPLLSMLFIPFVFAGQLLAVALLFALPPAFALPVIIVFAAALEELAKSIHVYAGFARSRFEATLPMALTLGALSGAGFFVGEKATHVVQLVGLPELELGEAVFGPALELAPLTLAAVFFAPLVLHVVTAGIAAIGASRGRGQYALAFLVATLVHAAYNLGVLVFVA